MRRYFKKRSVLKTCHIYSMLKAAAQKPHLSFHTPGHKIGKWDITELSFSDNLSCPSGCIATAQEDIAKRLDAEKSFILTDGSTSGVLSMLYAAKRLGVKQIAVSEASHKSVFHGCMVTGITPLLLPQKYQDNIPLPITMYALNGAYDGILTQADAVMVTSPDYYGNVADLSALRKYLEKTGKLLLVDGAHGGHLHYEKALHASAYADMWVDGVHKSLPALTQGAVVSARTEACAEALEKAVDIFRTTSPSYPIMASVEYAVKYPRNARLEKAVADLKATDDRFYQNDDYTKLCVKLGKSAFAAAKWLEKQGVYPEFCDGNAIVFYLSPATTAWQFFRLKRALKRLFKNYPYVANEVPVFETKPCFDVDGRAQEWIDLNDAEGRVCAVNCGLFPPCVPLLRQGEVVTKEKIALMQSADNVFGLSAGKIAVLKDEETV